MGTVTADAKEKAEGLAQQLRGVVDAGQEKLAAAKDRIIEGKDMVADRARTTLDAVTGTIKEHPLKSVAAAFAIGYIGMRILR